MKLKPRRGILIVGMGAALCAALDVVVMRREDLAYHADRLLIVETPDHAGKTEKMLEQIALQIKIAPVDKEPPFILKRRVPEWKEPPRHWNGR